MNFIIGYAILYGSGFVFGGLIGALIACIRTIYDLRKQFVGEKQFCGACSRQMPPYCNDCLPELALQRSRKNRLEQRYCELFGDQDSGAFKA